jgi:hypothetical protein
MHNQGQRDRVRHCWSRRIHLSGPGCIDEEGPSVRVDGNASLNDESDQLRRRQAAEAGEKLDMQAHEVWTVLVGRSLLGAVQRMCKLMQQQLRRDHFGQPQPQARPICLQAARLSRRHQAMLKTLAGPA